MAEDHDRFVNVFPESKRFKTATVRAKILDIKKLSNIGLDMSELRCKDLEKIKCFRGPQPLDSSNIFIDTQSNGERYIFVKEPACSPSHTAEWPSFRKLHNLRFPNEKRQESLGIWYTGNQAKNQQPKIPVTYEKNAAMPNFDYKRGVPDMPEPRRKFKPIACDICNREFGSYSISIHRPQCMKKLMSSNN
ncbi:zinc finger protein 474-like [Daphnia carinata]|uniref:zinc finger protein 474-like n=1 Tax=Daphnia carinata TaxID=120202 RepID=UPI00257DE9AC|nr:zinc finger protein 474-like [Daphnia carinata]